MKAEVTPRVGLWQRLFPPGPNFVAMLTAQLEAGMRALDALARWCSAPSEAEMQAIFTIEDEADGLRRDLVFALSTAFSTPLDREDIGDLSELLDDIVDGVRNTVREAATLRVTPDAAMLEMTGHLREGLVELEQSLGCVPKHHQRALEHTAKAHHCGRLVERTYTRALGQLLDSEDFHHIFRHREAYSLLMDLGLTLERTSEKVAHALNKLG